MTDLFIVFYELGISMLKENGTLGYITPSSYFNSLAGAYMRKYLTQENLLKAVVDLKHFQAFSATTYTTITILKKGKEELHVMRRIMTNSEKCDIAVKNGYATLCDGVFIHKFDVQSSYIIPVIKSSKGIRQQIIYPYDEKGSLVSEDELRQDKKIYRYLRKNKEKLTKRSNEKDANKYWYAFGRSQAIGDTFKDKLAINSLLRSKDDFKFTDAPAGTGVYGGLYIVSETIPMNEIKDALKTDEFMSYIELCTIRINGTPVPLERYGLFAPTVRYPFLRLFIGSIFLMFLPFISKRYDSLSTRARLASA